MATLILIPFILIGLFDVSYSQHGRLDPVLRGHLPMADENCGCDEEGMMHHLQEKLLAMTQPKMATVRDDHSYGFHPKPHHGRSGSVATAEAAHIHAHHSSAHAPHHSYQQPSRQYNFQMSPRLAKVNEYFYKSDLGHNVMSPYTLKGKDGRLYTNYRPDTTVPMEHMPQASYNQFVAVNSPNNEPSRHVLGLNSFGGTGHRVPRSLMSPTNEQLFGQGFQSAPVSNPVQPEILKRSDASDMMFPGDFGGFSSYGRASSMSSPMSSPMSSSMSSPMSNPLWSSFSMPQQWSSSNMSPVPVRLPGMSPLAATGTIASPVPGATPVSGMMSPTGGRINPMDSNPMNMHNWYNFLNQPFYGPMPGSMGFPGQMNNQGTNSNSDSNNNNSGEKNSSEESSNNSNNNNDDANKTTNRRQRLLNQLNNLSKAPLENLRNFFNRVASTSTTTEAPKEDS